MDNQNQPSTPPNPGVPPPSPDPASPASPTPPPQPPVAPESAPMQSPVAPSPQPMPGSEPTQPAQPTQPAAPAAPPVNGEGSNFEPPKKKRWPKIVLIVLGVIVGLFIILVVIGSFLKPNLELTEYTNSEFNYSIQRPKEWEEETKTSFNTKSTLFVDRVKGEKNLYRAYMEISAVTEKDTVLVEQSEKLFDEIQDALKTELSGFSATETKKEDFKGNKARRVEGTYKSGSETGRAIVLIVVEADGQAQAVLLAAPESAFKTYEETFNKIIESFKP